MKKVNRIINNSTYKEHLKKIADYEMDREYCKHDMPHFLDVARIGYIMNFELGLKHDKETIYAFALLHDIGRWCQYEMEEDHELASVRLAKPILVECGFSKMQTDLILDAIRYHRLKKYDVDHEFATLMARADKTSRACYNCLARKGCHWSDEKKNIEIIL